MTGACAGFYNQEALPDPPVNQQLEDMEDVMETLKKRVIETLDMSEDDDFNLGKRNNLGEEWAHAYAGSN